MKPKLIMLLLAFLMSAPTARAQDDTLKQYYGYLQDTCKRNNVERVWNRWFGDKDKSLTEDTCCMNSVAQMEKHGARLAENGTCPEGFDNHSLNCPTTKEWCEKLATP